MSVWLVAHADVNPNNWFDRAVVADYSVIHQNLAYYF